MHCFVFVIFPTLNQFPRSHCTPTHTPPHHPTYSEDVPDGEACGCGFLSPARVSEWEGEKEGGGVTMAACFGGRVARSPALVKKDMQGQHEGERGVVGRKASLR